MMVVSSGEMSVIEKSLVSLIGGGGGEGEGERLSE